MGEHVHEHVTLEVDADQVTADKNSTDEEKLIALIKALTDEDVDVSVTTETE